MTASKWNETKAKQDFDILLREVRRLREDKATHSFESSKPEVQHLVVLRGDRGQYFLNNEAQERLSLLVTNSIASFPELAGRVDNAVFRSTLEELIVTKCLDGNVKMTPALAKEFLDAARSATAAKLVSQTYFFPVHTVYADEVDEYQVGPTAFLRTSLFFERFKSQWQQARSDFIKICVAGFEKEGKQMEGSPWKEPLLETESFIKEFRWMAGVLIRDADPKIGLAKAHEVLELSCCLIRLSMPRRRGSFVGSVIQTTTQQEERHVYVDASGTLWHGGVNRLVDVPVRGSSIRGLLSIHQGMTVLESIIHKVAEWKLLLPAEHRLLTAMRWFNEGWKEPNDPMCIVKFCTCLEALLSTGNKEDLTETIAERHSVLCNKAPNDLLESYKTVKAVYDKRSHVVHGDDASIPASDAEHFAWLAEDLGRETILQFAALTPLFSVEQMEFESQLKRFFLLAKLAGFDAAETDLRARIPAQFSSDKVEAKSRSPLDSI